MGVDFYCNDKTFSCSYGNWNIRRMAILKATYNYLIYTISNYKNEDYSEEELKDQIERHLIIINEIFENGLVQNIDKFLHNVYSKRHFSLDTIIKYGAGGIYALLNKSDCEGHYSPGNCLDICILLDLIKEYYDVSSEDTEWIKNSIYNENAWSDGLTDDGYVCLYKLFEEGCKTGKNINIC